LERTSSARERARVDCVDPLTAESGWKTHILKYKDQGLVVIGVHAPEFEFEKNVDNVRWAAKDMRVDYPIAIDNDHAIWRAFNNEYWPALYSSMRGGIFDIINSARANTNSRR
jgi:hypothetical protein